MTTITKLTIENADYDQAVNLYNLIHESSEALTLFLEDEFLVAKEGDNVVGYLLAARNLPMSESLLDRLSYAGARGSDLYIEDIGLAEGQSQSVETALIQEILTRSGTICIKVDKDDQERTIYLENRGFETMYVYEIIPGSGRYHSFMARY